MVHFIELHLRGRLVAPSKCSLLELNFIVNFIPENVKWFFSMSCKIHLKNLQNAVISLLSFYTYCLPICAVTTLTVSFSR